jgi:hypothetical protein
MGKELSTQAFIISMVIISVISLLAIGALYYVLNQDVLLNNVSYTPATKEPSSFTLEINAPEDNSLVTDPNLVISGSTAAFATLIVTNGEETTGFAADKDGEFSKIVALKEGPNLLNIMSFDKQGAVKTNQKQIYFTKEAVEDEE